MPGMHGSIPANYALREADLILTLGGRFDDRVAVKGFATASASPMSTSIRARSTRPSRPIWLVAPLDQFFGYALETRPSVRHADWMSRRGLARQMPLPYADGDYIKPQAASRCSRS
jgi:acetolactate synthase-1/2/3 large subunit